MARPRKVPAVLVEATVRSNAKLAALPSDAARLGVFYVVLGEGKLSKPIPGQFASRTQFSEVAGRFARYLRDYIAAGIVEEAPRLCDRCKAHWASMPPTKGVLIVHDWHEYQYDPQRLERQREYDARQRPAEDPVSDGVSDPVSDAQSDGVSDAHSDPVSDDISRASARGGGRRRAANAERRTENEEIPHVDVDARANGAGPTLSKAQLDAWSAFDSQWDAFKLAWLHRGFRLPPSGEPDDPTGQRGMLYPILDARPRSLPEWIRQAKGRTTHQVISHVLERWHAIQAEAGVEDDEAEAVRARRRSGSVTSLGDIVDEMPTWKIVEPDSVEVPS